MIHLKAKRLFLIYRLAKDIEAYLGFTYTVGRCTATLICIELRSMASVMRGKRSEMTGVVCPSVCLLSVSQFIQQNELSVWVHP